MKPLGPNDKERVSTPLALQQFLLRVRQVVEVFGFLKVFAVAAHQDFVAGNILATSFLPHWADALQ